jgi:choline dehydrogenase-like flavoprotein
MTSTDARPEHEYDAIVVGSGPGGATVARELSRKGKDVLILEWGDFDPVRGKALETIKRALIPGKGLLLTDGFLGMIRAITTGGSSVIYCATAFDPPSAMFLQSGVDLVREIAELKREIPIAPLEDRLVGPGPRLFFESASALGYDVRRLNKFIHQDRCRPSCQLCSYGCPYGAKWNARFFVEDAIKAGATIINHARVTRVLFEGGRAVGVAYRKDGLEKKAYARKVVISAGGIGTPLILKESGIPEAGRDFFFDPLVFVFGRIEGLEEGRAVPMTTGVHLKEEGIVMTDFNMPRILKIGFDAEVLGIRQAFAYKDVLPVMIKIRDDLGGRITRRGSVRKPLTRADKMRLQKGSEHASRILRKAGAKEIYKSWVFAAHPGGTAKMGELVDSDLKTRFEGLYVCDCSVMPQEMGIPPTFTILALAKRLSAHLLGEEGSGGITNEARRAGITGMP